MGDESCCLKVIVGLKQIMYISFGNSRQGFLNADRHTAVPPTQQLREKLIVNFYKLKFFSCHLHFFCICHYHLVQVPQNLKDLLLKSKRNILTI